MTPLSPRRPQPNGAEDAALERAAEAYFLAGWYPDEPPIRYADMSLIGRQACRDRARFILDAARSETLPTCIDCGAPRSIGSAERCRRCYMARAAHTRSDERVKP